MSAPFDLRLIVGWANGRTTATVNEVMGVRYLRADLTCGECAKWFRDCPHTITVHSWTDCGSPLVDDYEPKEEMPACVAFVPKEGR